GPERGVEGTLRRQPNQAEGARRATSDQDLPVGLDGNVVRDVSVRLLRVARGAYGHPTPAAEGGIKRAGAQKTSAFKLFKFRAERRASSAAWGAASPGRCLGESCQAESG